MEKRLTADLNVVANSNLEIQLLDGDLNIIQKLDDEPNDVGGLTSAELKAKFDESGNIIKKYINDTLIPAVLTDDATEESRKQAEAARAAAEQGRVTAEEGRVSAEQGRTSAESIRVQNEQKRVSAENSRVKAEAQRAAAEQARADENTGIVAQATAQANAAAGSAESASASAQTAQSAASTASSAAAAASGSASQAIAAAASAAQSAASVDGINKTAQSWAVGGTGTRPGEDTDNAKYWAEQAQAVVGGDFATKVEAQGYVMTHNQSDAAHPDLRAAVAGSVRYDAAQSLSDTQKEQARSNINAAPGGFGLGENIDVPYNVDANECLNNGWYAPGKNVPVDGIWIVRVDAGGGYVRQTAYAIKNSNAVPDYVVCRRSFSQNKWSPWEWVNPPMELGVEYRTTERYLGKPVYVKAVDCGEITNGKEITTGIYYSIKVDVVATSSYYSLPLPRVPFQTTAAGLPSNYSTAFYVNANKIIFICGTSGSGDHGTAIIRYTKTTD